jgi:hypothetical protein
MPPPVQGASTVALPRLADAGLRASCVSAVVILPRSRSHAPLPRASLPGKRTHVCVWRPTLPGVVARWNRVDATATVATVSGDDRVRERAARSLGERAARKDLISSYPNRFSTIPNRMVRRSTWNMASSAANATSELPLALDGRYASYSRIDSSALPNHETVRSNRADDVGAAMMVLIIVLVAREALGDGGPCGPAVSDPLACGRCQPVFAAAAAFIASWDRTGVVAVAILTITWQELGGPPITARVQLLR